MAVDPVNPAVPTEATQGEGRVKNSFPDLTRQGEYHVLQLGQRQYRVGGLDKNNSLEMLKVAVRLAVTINHEPSTMNHTDEVRFHLDSFDMTRDNERRRFIERSAEETGLEKELIKRDLGKLLLALEDSAGKVLEVIPEYGASNHRQQDS